jgi:hypothetical protein
VNPTSASGGLDTFESVITFGSWPPVNALPSVDVQSYSGRAARQEMSSDQEGGARRCSLIVRRLQGLLSSNPGDALRAPSGIWLQPVLRVPSNGRPVGRSRRLSRDRKTSLFLAKSRD